MSNGGGRGRTPILAFPPQGGRDGSPHARGQGGGRKRAGLKPAPTTSVVGREGTGDGLGGRRGRGGTRLTRFDNRLGINLCLRMIRFRRGTRFKKGGQTSGRGGFVFSVVETKGGFGEGVGVGGFHGGMVAGEGDFGQGEVGSEWGESPPS